MSLTKVTYPMIKGSPVGIYDYLGDTVSANTTVDETIALIGQVGFPITINNDVTLTINGPFQAGVYQVFNCIGTGKVVFNWQYVSVGYPEWWGAVTNDGSFDCLPALKACVLACPVTELQAADYITSGTWKINSPSRTIRGQGFDYLGGTTAPVTRIVVLSASATVIQIGPDTQPVGGINDFLTEVKLENLQVTRDQAPINGSQCAGVKLQFTLYAFVDRVKSAENEFGFHYAGNVSTHTSQCYAFRSVAGTGVGIAEYYGYYVDGISYNIGAAGGNASIYFDECNSSGAGSVPSNSIGFFLQGNFTDCYVANGEFNSTGYGIFVEGNSLTTQQYGNNDLLITAPVCDVFTFAGIRFDQVSKFGSISVNGGYCAPAATTSAVAGLYFTDSYGQISVTDFQTICNSSTTCTGVSVVNSSNIETKTQIIDTHAPAISLTGATNSRFLDHVTNYGDTAGNLCELISGNNRNYFQVFAAGKSSAFTGGYVGVGTSNTYNELNCTGIDPACITGGSANKLVWNGTQITVTGPISTGTTNLASGIMA